MNIYEMLYIVYIYGNRNKENMNYCTMLCFQDSKKKKNSGDDAKFSCTNMQLFLVKMNELRA